MAYLQTNALLSRQLTRTEKENSDKQLRSSTYVKRAADLAKLDIAKRVVSLSQSKRSASCIEHHSLKKKLYRLEKHLVDVLSELMMYIAITIGTRKEVQTEPKANGCACADRIRISAHIL